LRFQLGYEFFLLRFFRLTVLRYWLKVWKDWLMGVNWQASGQLDRSVEFKIIFLTLNYTSCFFLKFNPASLFLGLPGVPYPTIIYPRGNLRISEGCPTLPYPRSILTYPRVPHPLGEGTLDSLFFGRDNFGIQNLKSSKFRSFKEIN